MALHVSPFNDLTGCPKDSILHITKENLSLELYPRLSTHVRTLIIDGVSEDELFQIFLLFPGVENMGLRNITIFRDYNSQDSVPIHLQSLMIDNCRMETHFTIRWFSAISTTRTLQRISVYDSFNYLSLSGGRSLIAQLCFLGNVNEVSVGDPRKCNFTKGQPKQLRKLTYDAPDDVVKQFLTSTTAKHTLTSLVLRSCPLEIRLLREFYNLEHLRIIEPVWPGEMKELTDLQLPSLEVDSLREDRPPAAIFMLNEDCLAHILGYLPINKWWDLAGIHSRFEEVVCASKSRAEFVLNDDQLEKYSSLLGLGVLFNQWAPLAKSLSLSKLSTTSWLTVIPCFTNLQQLTLSRDRISDKILKLIPNGLHTLKLLDFEWIDSAEFNALLARLDRSLRTLHIVGVLPEDVDLRQLHHIRDIKIHRIQYIFNDHDFQTFMNQNRQNLISVDIGLREGISISGHFPNLIKLNCRHLYDLHAKDFPRLEEVSITVAPHEMEGIVGRLASPTKLRSLTVRADVWPFPIFELRHFHCLTNIRKLSIWGEMKEEQEQEILDLIQHLPMLTEFGTMNHHFSLKFEASLRRNLSASRRSLKLFNTKCPKMMVFIE